MPTEPKYVMPEVMKGDIVNWFPGFPLEDEQSCPGIVTGVGDRAISISLFPPNNRGCAPQEGVLHASDPNSKTLRGNFGLWQHTERTQRTQRALLAEKAVADMLS